MSPEKKNSLPPDLAPGLEVYQWGVLRATYGTTSSGSKAKVVHSDRRATDGRLHLLDDNIVLLWSMSPEPKLVEVHLDHLCDAEAAANLLGVTNTDPLLRDGGTASIATRHVVDGLNYVTVLDMEVAKRFYPEAMVEAEVELLGSDIDRWWILVDRLLRALDDCDGPSLQVPVAYEVARGPVATARRLAAARWALQALRTVPGKPVEIPR